MFYNQHWVCRERHNFQIVVNIPKPLSIAPPTHFLFTPQLALCPMSTFTYAFFFLAFLTCFILYTNCPIPSTLPLPLTLSSESFLRWLGLEFLLFKLFCVWNSHVNSFEIVTFCLCKSELCRQIFKKIFFAFFLNYFIIGQHMHFSY